MRKSLEHVAPELKIDLIVEISDDWLRARRLKKKAEKGDKAAQEEHGPHGIQ